MFVHGYEVDLTKGFTCTKGKSSYTFHAYAEAVKFIQNHYGYMITYYVIKPEETE